ncbi:hypothetical protein PCL_11419 [Purpureocillium lilacinum]|uniref:Uncharacterized protein n=1 Tax=Purpureocillium lilacinum TaxID=33203 RepID=A0A2U3E9Z6_PURLI|nr:hypothetical protein Purlil1_2681 [Purpureocillium lilacinum]PWI71325.1 hypothetical protein PCL_11419 [Purpureocillium lilacinum]
MEAKPPRPPPHKEHLTSSSAPLPSPVAPPPPPAAAATVPRFRRLHSDTKYALPAHWPQHPVAHHRPAPGAGAGQPAADEAHHGWAAVAHPAIF